MPIVLVDADGSILDRLKGLLAVAVSVDMLTMDVDVPNDVLKNRERDEARAVLGFGEKAATPKWEEEVSKNDLVPRPILHNRVTVDLMGEICVAEMDRASRIRLT